MPLTEEEVRRVQDVLAESVKASSLGGFLATSLAAIEERLGYHEAAFMLTLADSPRAYAGVKHGSPPYVLEEYFERWADADPLGSAAARASFTRQGWTSLSGIYPSLGSSERRFVDDFLRRTRTTAQLSVRLAANGSDGYVTVMRDEEFTAHDRELLGALLPGLRRELRKRLPRGLDGGLSRREAQVAELVAIGFTNREIGEILHVEEDTVKKHVSRVLSRLAMKHRTELAVAWATGRRLDLTDRGSLVSA